MIKLDRLFRLGVVVLLMSVLACGESAPTANQKEPVRKKIAVQQNHQAIKPAPVVQEGQKTEAASLVPPNGSDANQEAKQAISETKIEPGVQLAAAADRKPALTEQETTSVGNPETGAAAEITPAQSSTPPEISDNTTQQSVPAPASDLIKESLQVAGTYDPAGRFDPFEPLFKEQNNSAEVKTSKGKHDKRVPQTPLERVSLSQLKVTAILRSTEGNSALVEDATGKGYVIKRGTYIGLNSGRVIEIDKSRILIEEEIENVMGELTIQKAELKLQKPAGEL